MALDWKFWPILGGLSATDTVTVTVTEAAPETSANNPLVADAGDDQTVQEGATVTPDGAASDADGHPLTYLRSHDSPAMSPDDATSLSPEFTTHLVSANTTITFTMTVSAGADTASDSMTLTVTDVP